MYLSNTSLIPTVLSVSGFFLKSFPNFWWYPYWYLGNPYQYLIGPVVPMLLIFLNLFNLPLLDSYLLLLLMSFILGSVGIYLLLRDWGLGGKQSLVSAFLYLILPFGAYLLNYQNGLNHFAFGVFPYLLLVYRRFLRNKCLSILLLLCVLISIVLLIDVSILLSIIIGFASVFFGSNIDKKDFGELIGKTIVVILLSVSVATFWYTPSFWLVNLANPSFGGVPLFRLIVSLFQFLLSCLPFVFAVLIVRLRKFRPKGYLLFATLFFSSFLFLTIVRFLADPVFVTDWTSFLLELQFGLVIIIGSLICRIRERRIRAVITGLLVFFSIWGLIFVMITLFPPQRDYQKRIISLISRNVKDNRRIFLSGSAVFWLNSFLTVQQVRGGTDQSAVNPVWAQGAYQIREGTDGSLSYDWLSLFGASYILVHGPNSQEPFHDFKYPGKFTGSYFKRIDTDRGDTLYMVKGVSVARAADRSILSTPAPQNGADWQTLSSYENDLKKPLDYRLKGDDISITGRTGKNEVIFLAITYSPDFRLVQGGGTVVYDSIGNIIIIPKAPGEQKFVLEYRPALSGYLISLLSLVILIYILIFYDTVIPQINKFVPKLHLGLGEEE